MTPTYTQDLHTVAVVAVVVVVVDVVAGSATRSETSLAQDPLPEDEPALDLLLGSAPALDLPPRGALAIGTTSLHRIQQPNTGLLSASPLAQPILEKALQSPQFLKKMHHNAAIALRRATSVFSTASLHPPAGISTVPECDQPYSSLPIAPPACRTVLQHANCLLHRSDLPWPSPPDLPQPSPPERRAPHHRRALHR
jgi:hypothetical protein